MSVNVRACIVLSTGNRTVSKWNKNPCPHEADSLEQKTDNKRRSKSVCQVVIRAVEKNKTRKSGWRGFDIQWGDPGKLHWWGDILQRPEGWEGARPGDTGESCPEEHPVRAPVWTNLVPARPAGPCGLGQVRGQGRKHDVTEIPEVWLCRILQATMKEIGSHGRILCRAVPWWPPFLKDHSGWSFENRFWWWNIKSRIRKNSWEAFAAI